MAMAESMIEMRVAAISEETPEIRRFELECASGKPLPDFAPGSHIDLHFGDSLVRQYSLCNGPLERDRYVVAVKREPRSRGGSVALHERIRVNDVVGVTGPRNHFPLAEAGGEHLLLAAGIGVTPLLSMARHLQATAKPFRLKYFTRSKEHTAFHSELSEPAWQEQVEFLHGLDPAQLTAYFGRLFSQVPEDGHVYVCGPRPFMDLALDSASEFYPKGNIHSEYFSSDTAALARETREFTVRCARSDRTLVVPPDRSILDVLSINGIEVDVVCEQGVCGTCMTGVLEGRPDHRDSFLTEEERKANDQIMVCCSRSLDPLLILDI